MTYVNAAVWRKEAVGAAAGCDGGLQSVLVPAVDEIAVQTVASKVTHRVHPLVESVVEDPGVVEEFHEDTENGNWVGLRAHASIIGACLRVGHLGYD